MANISSISISRPVLASVLSAVILIFGLISYPNLGVREYPVVDLPVITVSTTYAGASAEIIDIEITEPIEDQVNAVSGIRTLTSISEEGRSTIRVEFGIDMDLEVAANDVRDRVSRAVENLPPDANPPSIRKEDADSGPILFMNISSSNRDRLELTQIARDVFRERLRTIDGISIVSVWGQQRYAIRLWLNPRLLSAYNISPQDIRDAIARENIELPSGIIEGELIELTIRTMGRMVDVEEFNNLIIKEEGGHMVRFRDIGHAELGTRDDRSILKRNGVPMVGIAAIPQPGANQIDARDELLRRIDLIKDELPDDIEVSVGFDNTEFVRESILEVGTTIGIAFFLVIFIIFAFLRDFRTTLIPMTVVPIALIGSFFIMYFGGFSINVLTLLALVLAIGLVIDDAIIVLESIYTKMEEGLPPRDAGILGTREIFFAVISTTLALISVFTPILFLEGITGKLFVEFGVVLAGVVIISSFVALTLIPMMCVKLLKSGQKKSKFYHQTEPLFQNLNQWYSKALNSFLRNAKLIFGIFGFCIVAAVFLFSALPKELAPLEDRSFIRVDVRAPEGASFDYMDRIMDQVIVKINNSTPEIEVLNTVTSPNAINTGSAYLKLVHPTQRDRSQSEIARHLERVFADIPEAVIRVSQTQSLSSDMEGLPIQFVVQAGNYKLLRKIIPEFLRRANDDPTFSFVDVNLRFTRPDLRVEVDRNRAVNLGVSMSDIAQTLQLAYSGSRYGYFDLDGRRYWVVGQVMRSDRNEPEDLLSLHIQNNRGELIQLDNLVTLTESSSPPQLYRFNRLASATFSASLAPEYAIEDGILAMRNIGAELLDDRYSVELAGVSRDFQESADSMFFIFLLALVFIYLVLAAQFESLRWPLVILLTVPLALFGALFSLWYFDASLNIYSQIGMVMLVGLVTKNAILIVDFFNQRINKGMNYLIAIKSAAASRFRPILMTTLSTSLGMLPLILFGGAGAEGRSAMGFAVIGGLLVGTFLTLFVIPAVLTFFYRKKHSI